MLKKLFAMLAIPESELPRVEPLLTILLRITVIAGAGLMAGALIYLLVVGDFGGAWAISGPVLLAAGLLLPRLSQRGRISLTANLLLGLIMLYATLADLLGFPARDVHILVYVVCIGIAALTLMPAAVWFWGGVAAFGVFIQTVVFIFTPEETVNYLVVLLRLAALGGVTYVVWFYTRTFHETQSAFRRRIQQGQAGIEIGHIVSAAIDPPSVIRQAVHLIHDAFGYYHVGLFTVNAEEETAMLADAAGAAAQELLDRGFSTSLTGTSPVAAAIAQKRKWRLTSWEESVDARGRPVEFTYARMSGLSGRGGLTTRVELVIPLQVRDQVLGALDIHSTELEAFPEEDVHTLEGLVGHVSNALEGARLLNDIQRRHQELETIYEQTERRARYLAATAELAGATSSLLDPRELLPRAAKLISEILDLYHAGIFLVDNTGEWAVLMAASSEGGQRMLARGHKLRVGQQGIVGWVTNTGQSRIALDVGEDAIYFTNPELPETHSEIALPLKIGDRVIGALDVQSTYEAAFSEEDATILQTLADQLAVAIQNARLFQETQQALEEVEALQRYYVAQEWDRLARQRADVNAEYRSLGVPSLEEDWTPEMKIALSQEAPVVIPDLSAVDWGGDGGGDTAGSDGSLPAQAALVVPIKLQGEVIGILDLQEVDEPRHWTEDEVELVSTVADQLALALENVRLFEETRRRASQLAAASAIARDATAILDVNQLLEETVKLISERFGFYHAGVFLTDEQNEYAVLRAASSAGGQRMLARGHRLRVSEGVVGSVAGSGEAHITLDVTADPTWVQNPDLPSTRAEMALPLKARGRVIGALDVQSTQAASFTEDDVAVVQTMADQLATAIANADLFQQVRQDAMRRALINEVNQAAASSLNSDELLARASEAISRQLEMPCSIFEWNAEADALRPVTVHDQAGRNAMPIESSPLTAEMDPVMFRAIRTRQLQVLFDVTTNVHGPAAELTEQLNLLDVAYIPLMARDQILGLLALGRHRGHPVLDESELSFLEVVASNLGVALENARLYQDAVQTAERLEEVDKLKTQFLANMSHELRTPLNSIIGFSRVILKEIDGPLTDMQRSDLQTVYESGQHLLGLINNILDVVKIEAGKMEISFEDVELPPIITSVMAAAVGFVREKPIELKTILPDDLPVIRGDSRRIRQVLLNLVGNASKFTEEGFIRVEAQADKKKVTIAVSDSGIGIPEDKLGTIFEAFTQVDGSSTRRAGGTGLGLSICQSFVEMHGGRIWVESSPGKGSTFFFTLPIEGPPIEAVELLEQVEEMPMLEERPRPAKQPEKASKLVLCVEDDEGVITLFRRYLSKRGYQVVGLNDPTRVMEEAKRLSPHAITLDVMMPDKNGWQVIQELKADPETRHIPVIMCSIVADKERGISLGAADYLVKPIIEQDLLDALDRLDREAGQHLVLVVDDQAEHRQLLRRIIENQDGYEVLEAEGGKEAINLIQHVHPHIIMLDLMMPEMDGFEVLERVKSDEATRTIPIVVVTAKELTDEDYQRLNNHVEALVQKGLMKRDELLEDVAAALKKLTRHVPD